MRTGGDTIVKQFANPIVNSIVERRDRRMS